MIIIPSRVGPAQKEFYTSDGFFTLWDDGTGTMARQIRHSDNQISTRQQTPYGAERGTRQNTWQGSHGFTGGIENPGVGLVRMGIRDYDPASARFLKPDPLLAMDNPINWNPYAYGNSAPINQPDPNGDTPMRACIDTCSGDQEATHHATPSIAGQLSTTGPSGSPTPSHHWSTPNGHVCAGTICIDGRTGRPMQSHPRALAAGFIHENIEGIEWWFNRDWRFGRNFFKTARNMGWSDSYKKMVQGWGIDTDSEDFQSGEAGSILTSGVLAVASLPKAASSIIKLGRLAKTTNLAKTTIKAACFVAGTQVLLADGSRKPIETIQTGDRVTAYNPDTGQQESKPVVEIYVHHNVPTYDLTLAAGEKVTTTSEHPFWVEGKGWTPVHLLQPGDQLRDTNGTHPIVGSVTPTGKTTTVYNLNIQDLHNYYIHTGPHSILVHNTCELEEAAKTGSTLVDAGKYDYLFGNVASNAHNAARSAQNAQQLARIGVYNNPAGRSLLSSHFDEVVSTNSNIARTFTNEHGLFQVRVSLFAGPGGFLKFESTWQVTDGGFKLTTVIPKGGR